MGWYQVYNMSGELVKRIFVTTLEDLASNVPSGFTVVPM